MALAHILELASPGRCVECARPGGILCPACRSRMRRAAPRPPPPPLAGLSAAWAYEGAGRALILALKLRGERSAAAVLAEDMRRAALRSGLRGSTVTWVPGRRADARARGFDHAEVLAHALGARLGLPAARLLGRCGSRPDQTSLGAAGRWSNLEGAFQARPGAARAGGVILVDDLVTTGATARSCALALLEGGARSVELVTACSAASTSRFGLAGIA